MTVQEAVARFVHDGDYVASGGFGMVRIATAILHEIVRQGRKDLGFSGHTATHDFQIMCAGEVLRPLRCSLHRRPGAVRPLATGPPLDGERQRAGDRVEQRRPGLALQGGRNGHPLPAGTFACWAPMSSSAARPR